MKLVRNILMFAVGTIVMSSCFDLESKDYDTINPGMFPANDKDVVALTTAKYSLFSCGGWGNLLATTQVSYMVLSDMVTDIGVCKWDDGGSWYSLYTQNWTPNTGTVTGLFGKYKGIGELTLTIDRIESFTMQDPVLKKRLIAEMKCGRGFLSYMLYDLYGPVPVPSLELLKDPMSDVQIPRQTKEEMYELMTGDLLSAIDGLPDKYDAGEYGRFTKGVAQTVLMKVYMAYGKWAEAAAIGKQIIGSGYTLQPTYASIFTEENQQNTEIIFAATSDITLNAQMWMTHVIPSNYPTNNTAIQKWGGYRMRWDFVDSFEPGDERLATIVTEFVSTDGKNIKRDGTYLPDGTKESNVSEVDMGAMPIKYGEDSKTTGESSGIDFVIYRYADVLLMTAECLTRANNAVTAEAIGYLNQIRERAKIPAKNAANFANVSAFLDAILLERAHELWFEGSRRTDLIRYGRYYDIVKAATGSTTIQPHFILFPVPQGTINEGKGVITQNPGY